MPDSPTSAQGRRLRDVIASRLGLHFEDDKLPSLRRALEERQRVTGERSARSYIDLLASSASEPAQIARHVTTAETYFLRDLKQFRALASVLIELASRGRSRIRILSAGCASGEEAYSAAMIALDSLQASSGIDVRVLGLDVNPDCIALAREAAYSDWSLRDTSPRVRARYFRHEGSRHVVVGRVRRLVTFRVANLADPTSRDWLDGADIVFCRNVLMYMTRGAARDVVGHLARALQPDGHLFLGHAETLRSLTEDFVLRNTHGTFYYQRRSHAARAGAAVGSFDPASGPPADSAPVESWTASVANATDRIARLSRRARSTSSPALPAAECARDGDSGSDGRPLRSEVEISTQLTELVKRERFTDALGALTETGTQPNAARDLLRATLLLNTGDTAAAKRQCASLLEVDPLDAGAFYVLGLCLEQSGDTDGAREHCRSAAYLDPDFAMPHVQLGRLARRSGDPDTAKRELGTAIGLLSREQPARILLFGGGFGRKALMQACRAELQACAGAA